MVNGDGWVKVAAVGIWVGNWLVDMLNGDGCGMGGAVVQVLTASVPKEMKHLTTLMSMGGESAAVDGHQMRAACS